MRREKKEQEQVPLSVISQGTTRTTVLKGRAFPVVDKASSLGYHHHQHHVLVMRSRYKLILLLYRKKSIPIISYTFL